MRKLTLVLLFFCFISIAFSQRTPAASAEMNGIKSVQLPTSNQGNILASPFEGQRFTVRSDFAVDGNPLLFEDWKSGEVTLINNEKYKVEKINFDASNNKFIYLKNDTMYEFFDNVQQIRIFNENHFDESSADMIFRSDIVPASGSFVEILVTGKITVFQEYLKKPEGENYSNGIVNNTRKYVLHANQSALKNNKIIPLSFNSSTLDELTLDKKEQLNLYVKENKLKLKKQKDFIKAIAYYNLISKSA